MDWIPLAIGYFLGSIPFGLLLTRMIGIDIRQVGSGNIGTTNVLRTGNKGLAAATLLLDAGKGVAAVAIGRWLGGEMGGIVAGTAAFVGHCFPIWLKFRGGKGVATILGVTLAAAPLAGVIALATWACGALVTRYSSVGGMLAAIACPIAVWFLTGNLGWATHLAMLAALLIFQHRDNLSRLAAGTESKIGQKSK
ncbi:MAG: acyl-phosphate glycerol 3-phosphate acyltransferase [Sphingomonadales bacterium 32-65-25]|nr:MAG: acyl-phosphate glycerol 3-phosphate acyltransferase [Sphingomonadales bacterium 12-62-5]OYX76457.1 MAG: acyl-phosphate glycerol 3-phosphate acyltransferase [Sphingomonadales bacterium 32-65-25]